MYFNFVTHQLLSDYNLVNAAIVSVWAVDITIYDIYVYYIVHVLVIVYSLISNLRHCVLGPDSIPADLYKRISAYEFKLFQIMSDVLSSEYQDSLVAATYVVVT